MEYKCRRCQSDKIGYNIGMYFIAYECYEEGCKHQWIERFKGIKDKGVEDVNRE